jgi:raffinose/stachyose/melibiose transport system substrate-binding protein
MLVAAAISAIVVGCSSSAATPAPSTAPSTAASPSTAAASATTAPTDSPAPSKQSVTITLMASQDWIKPAEQDLGKDFEAQTGIHVDYQIIPADQYPTVLKTKLISGEAADIWEDQSGISGLQLDNVAQNAVDLSDMAWTKQIDPAVLAQNSLGGKVYGAEIWDTVASNYFVLVYNKDVFTKLGLTVPTNFADFEAACAKIKAAGITPIYEPISDGWHHVLWFPMAGPAYEAAEPGLADKLNANTATFAGDANMTTAMGQINDLFAKGYFGDNTMSDTYADTSKQMASGKFAMTVAPLSEPASIEHDYPNVKASSFGYFPIPTFNNQLQPVHPAGPSKFVFAKSQHVAEAKAYIDFLTQPANLQKLLDNTPAFETLPFPNMKAKWDANQQTFFSTYQAKTLVYQDAVNYLNPQWMDIGKDMVSMFTGSMKPADVMKSIDTRRAEQAKAASDPAWK